MEKILESLQKRKKLLLLLLIIVLLEILGRSYDTSVFTFEFIPFHNITEEEAYTRPHANNTSLFSYESKTFFSSIANNRNIGGSTNMEKELATREFVRSLSSLSGAPLPNDISYPRDIYNYYQKVGKGRLICGVLSQLESELLNGMGVPNRIVQLIKIKSKSELYFSKHPSDTHVVVEVWSDRYQKWYVSDPTFNVVMFDQQGAPLSAAELRQKVYDQKTSDIQLVRGTKDTQDPTFDSYYINPFTLYDQIILRVGNPLYFINRYTNRYTESYRNIYITDKNHPPLILFPLLNFILDYVLPVSAVLVLILILLPKKHVQKLNKDKMTLENTS